MGITEKDITKSSVALLIIFLGILVFLVVKPLIISILAGLVFAYIFFPLYASLNRLIKSKGLSAAAVTLIALLIIIIPLWFFAPVIIEQAFGFFRFSQGFDFSQIVKKVFPSISDQLRTQLTLTVNNAITKLSSLIINALVDFLLDFARFLLHALIAGFVFFFTLRDNEKLREFTSSLSPLNKNQEKDLVKQFKDITDSIVYGQIVTGLVQGILAGIGLLIFGVPHALGLTIAFVIFSIAPLIGPPVIYIPVAAYIAATGEPGVAIAYLLYNLLIVSTIDNFLRTMLVAKKTRSHQVVILVGMIGGVYLFGFLGLILGPLILAYFITFLKAYKEKALSTFFSQD